MAGPYSVKLLRRAVAAAGTEAFFFERPPGFAFTAGQFLELTLTNEDAGPEDRVHSFSIASAPSEPDLMIATRLRNSVYKQALAELQPGDEVAIAGPYGSFVLSESAPRPIVFIAGGIGITPIRSILTEAARQADLGEMFLFYSNRQPEEAAFIAELAVLPRTPGDLNLVSTVTAADVSAGSWNGERGRVDLEMIARYVDPALASFYVSGPPPMVAGLRDLLTTAGIARGRIRVELFDGY
jgi:ferredoxin-NADP reductase